MLKPIVIAAAVATSALLFTACGANEKPPDNGKTNQSVPAEGDNAGGDKSGNANAGDKTGAGQQTAPGEKIGSGTMAYPEDQKKMIDQTTKVSGVKTVYVPESQKPEELGQINGGTELIALHYKEIEITESTKEISLGSVTGQKDVKLSDGTAAQWVNYTTNVDGTPTTLGALFFKIGDTNIAIGNGKADMDPELQKVAESLKKLK